MHVDLNPCVFCQRDFRASQGPRNTPTGGMQATRDAGVARKRAGLLEMAPFGVKIRKNSSRLTQSYDRANAHLNGVKMGKGFRTAQHPIVKETGYLRNERG